MICFSLAKKTPNTMIERFVAVKHDLLKFSQPLFG